MKNNNGFIAFLPNVLTLANLACGVLIIVFSFEFSFHTVAILAGFSLVFDFFDGFVARALKVQSSLGKELDSLADVVSFGVAPALVLYNFQQYLNIFQDSIFLKFWPILIAIFSAYRLAKFNITESNTSVFSGLPTPAFALGIFALPLVQLPFFENILENSWFIPGFILLGSVFLVSNVKLFKINFTQQNKSLRLWQYILLITCVLSIALFNYFGVFLCLFWYILFSLVAQKQLNTQS